MEIFIAIGIIIFAALFLLMSLPIYDEWNRVEPDTKTRDTMRDEL